MIRWWRAWQRRRAEQKLAALILNRISTGGLRLVRKNDDS